MDSKSRVIVTPPSALFAREVPAALKEELERVELALAEAAIHSLTPDGEDLTDWHDASLAHEPLARMDVWQALAVLQHNRRTMAPGRPAHRPNAARGRRSIRTRC